MGLRKEKPLQQVQTAVQAALPVGPYDPEDSMVLEMPVEDRGSIWILWQSPIDESQHNHLRFCSKTLPFYVYKYSPFKKQPLVCYWP